MRKTLRPLAAAGVLTAGVIGPVGSVAQADATATGSTIQANDIAHTVHYSAGSGQVNRPALDITAGVPAGGANTWVYTVHDVAPITAGTGCYRPDPADLTTVSCELHDHGDFNPMVYLDLGDLSDRLGHTDPGDVNVLGGPGNDVLVAGPGGASVDGGDGDDVLVSDWAVGGNGNDRMSQVRRGFGGPGNDSIVGRTDDPDGEVHISGGPGDDTISSGPGRDTVHGNSGRDLIRGGQARDGLYGGPGVDTIYGNGGDDHIEGGPAKDILSGGPGNDVVRQ